MPVLLGQSSPDAVNTKRIKDQLKYALTSVLLQADNLVEWIFQAFVVGIRIKRVEQLNLKVNVPSVLYFMSLIVHKKKLLKKKRNIQYTMGSLVLFSFL